MVLPNGSSRTPAAAANANAASCLRPRPGPQPQSAAAAAGDPSASALGGGAAADWRPRPAMNRPKRPMTAYNYFFREERQRILDVGLGPDEEELAGKVKGDAGVDNDDDSGDAAVKETNKRKATAATRSGSVRSNQPGSSRALSQSSSPLQQPITGKRWHLEGTNASRSDSSSLENSSEKSGGCASTSGDGWLSSSSSGNDDGPTTSGGSSGGEERPRKKARLSAKNVSMTSSNENGSDSSGDARLASPLSRSQKKDAVLGCTVSRSDSAAMSALSSSTPSNNGGTTSSDLSASLSSKKSISGNASARMISRISTTSNTEQEDISVCSFSCSSGFGISFSGMAAAGGVHAAGADKAPPVASVSNAKNLELKSKAKKRKRPSQPREKVSFLSLGRVIANRWKVVPKNDMERYSAMAAKDKKRYQREMAAYDRACVAAMSSMRGDRPFTKQATSNVSSDYGSEGCSSDRPKTSSDSGGTSSGGSVPEESRSVAGGEARPRPGGRKLTTKQRAEKKSMNALRKEAEEAMRSTKERLQANASTATTTLAAGSSLASSRPAPSPAPNISSPHLKSGKSEDGDTLASICRTGKERQQKQQPAKASAPGTTSSAALALPSAAMKSSNTPGGSLPTEVVGAGFSGLSQQQLASVNLQTLQQVQARQRQVIRSDALPTSYQTPSSSQEAFAMHREEAGAAGGGTNSGKAAGGAVATAARQGTTTDVALALRMGFLAGRLSSNPQHETQRQSTTETLAPVPSPRQQQALSQAQATTATAAAQSQEIAAKAAAWDALFGHYQQQQQQHTQRQLTPSAVAAAAASQMAPTTGASTATSSSEAAAALVLLSEVLGNNGNGPLSTPTSLTPGPTLTDSSGTMLNARIVAMLQQQQQEQAQALAQAQAQAAASLPRNVDQILAGVANLAAELQPQQTPTEATIGGGGLLHRHISHSRPPVPSETTTVSVLPAPPPAASDQPTAVATYALNNNSNIAAVSSTAGGATGNVVPSGQGGGQSPPSSDLSMSMLSDVASALSGGGGTGSGSDSGGSSSGGGARGSSNGVRREGGGNGGTRVSSSSGREGSSGSLTGPETSAASGASTTTPGGATTTTLRLGVTGATLHQQPQQLGSEMLMQRFLRSQLIIGLDGSQNPNQNALLNSRKGSKTHGSSSEGSP